MRRWFQTYPRHWLDLDERCLYWYKIDSRAKFFQRHWSDILG